LVNHFLFAACNLLYMQIKFCSRSWIGGEGFGSKTFRLFT